MGPLVLHYSAGSGTEGIPSVLDFEASSRLPTGLPLDSATACVDTGGVMYSNFRESRVKVMGPYFPEQQQNQKCAE